MDEAWTDQVRNWTANYFSVTDAEGNVAEVLRKIASSLDELGAVEVLDVTFCSDPDEDDVTMTVYFRFDDE